MKMKRTLLLLAACLLCAATSNVSAQQSIATMRFPASAFESPDYLAQDVTRPFQNISFSSRFGRDPACRKGCVGECSCAPVWAHRTGVFGEYLYLRPRDAEVAYAVEVDSVLGPPAIQVGPINVTDPDYSPGYRAGASLCIDDCTSLVATYSRLGTNTNHFIDVNPPQALRALVGHPGTLNAGADFLTGFANHDVDFDLVDVDYRAVWNSGELWAVNYIVGARYGRMEQDFQATFTNAGATEFVVTDIDFDGGGLRLGIDVERHACNTGLMAYGKAHASFLAGEFRGAYLEGSDVDPVIVETSWEAGRVVPILDLEVGVGWQSHCGHFRFTTGYMFSAWFNTLNTDEWIQAVHNNNFIGLDESVTFDGLTARAEYRF